MYMYMFRICTVVQMQGNVNIFPHALYMYKKLIIISWSVCIILSSATRKCEYLSCACTWHVKSIGSSTTGVQQEGNVNMFSYHKICVNRVSGVEGTLPVSNRMYMQG